MHVLLRPLLQLLITHNAEFLWLGVFAKLSYSIYLLLAAVNALLVLVALPFSAYVIYLDAWATTNARHGIESVELLTGFSVSHSFWSLLYYLYFTFLSASCINLWLAFYVIRSVCRRCNCTKCQIRRIELVREIKFQYNEPQPPSNGAASESTTNLRSPFASEYEPTEKDQVTGNSLFRARTNVLSTLRSLYSNLRSWFTGWSRGTPSLADSRSESRKSLWSY